MHACMQAHAHTRTSHLQRYRGLTIGSSKLERINLVGKWSLIGDRNQTTTFVCAREKESKRKTCIYVCFIMFLKVLSFNGEFLDCDFYMCDNCALLF